MTLRDLDTRLVPRLAAALRSLLDGAADRRDRTARTLTSPSSGRLRRLDDRFASTGPLALLRDVPQLGVLLVAAVFLTGAGVAVARNSPESVAEREQVEAEQALPLTLGPPVGADVDAHFATARERVVALSDESPDDVLLALVTLSDELTPEQAGAIVAEAVSLQVRRAYVRPPVGDGAQVLPVEVPGDVATVLRALFAATAERRAEEQRELLTTAASIPDDAGETDRRFKAQYVADAGTKGREAAAYRTACACVFALVVEGSARELAELPSLPAVRGVEVARRGASLPALRFDPLPPEVTDIRTASPAATPGG